MNKTAVVSINVGELTAVLFDGLSPKMRLDRDRSVCFSTMFVIKYEVWDCGAKLPTVQSVSTNILQDSRLIVALERYEVTRNQAMRAKRENPNECD